MKNGHGLDKMWPNLIDFLSRTPVNPMSREMPLWLETLLTIEAIVLMTVLAIAFPIAVAMLMHDLCKTLKRNRR